jgi:acetylornithine aminotransferase
MGNGYPIGGVLIHPSIKASHGLLGTTFGGNHLACAAGAAVLEIIKDEDLMSNAQKMGDFLLDQLKSFADITDIRGKGLMIGFDLNKDAGPVRSDLVHKCKTFTGSAAGKQTIRLLPALNIEINDLNSFIRNLKHVIH